jgi:hypothetical protein
MLVIFASILGVYGNGKAKVYTRHETPLLILDLVERALTKCGDERCVISAAFDPTNFLLGCGVRLVLGSAIFGDIPPM